MAPIAVEVAYGLPEDPEVARRVAELSEGSGGGNLGGHETVLCVEDVEVEEFGFDTVDAAEAVARVCEHEDRMSLVRTWKPIEE